MSNVRYVGLDVHKEFIVMAVADSSGAPAEVLRRLESPRVLAALRQLGPLSALKVCSRWLGNWPASSSRPRARQRRHPRSRPAAGSWCVSPPPQPAGALRHRNIT
jgi:hypothetical protein